MKLKYIFSQPIWFCYLNTMDLKKDFNFLISKLFWARHKSEFGEHQVTHVSNNVWRK